MTLIEENMKNMREDLKSVKAEIAKSRTKDKSVLYNFNWHKDVDDLDTKPDFIKEVWADIGAKKNEALSHWIKLFIQKTPRFFKLKSDKLIIKGIIGDIDGRKFGIDGCESTFTMNTFYNAFVHNMCDVVERSYCDILYEKDIRDPADVVAKTLRLKYYYRPKRSEYKTDAEFREANRKHKSHKTEIITVLKTCMLNKIKNENSAKCL